MTSLSSPTPPQILLLFSSPLSADPVGVDLAQRQLTDALRGLDAPGQFHTMVAEADAVSALMTRRDRPRFDILHYYGHGYKPDGLDVGRLIFEDQSGGMRPWDPFQLRAMLNPSNKGEPEFSLAILTACHSESVASAVHSLGVPHIVAVDADESVYVIAAVAFFRRFYQALLTGSTVREAFDAGRNAVLIDEAVNRLGADAALHEAGKFKLLPEGASHDLALPGAGSGAATVTPLPQLTGAHFQRPASFVGREENMQAVLSMLHQRRTVQIIGFSGVGKTELAKEIAHWLVARRRVDAGRTWFVPLLNVTTARAARTAIAVAMGLPAESLPADEAAADAALAAALPPGSLLLLDEAEEMVRHGGLAVRRLLEALATAAAHPHVIVTSQKEVSSGHLPRYDLKRLTAFHARLLFAQTAHVSSVELEAFDQAELDRVLDYVDGTPRAVELVARQWRRSRSPGFGPLLRDLARLQDQIMHDPDYPDEVKSVTVGVRLAFERLAGYSPQAAALWPLLALFPGGLPEAGFAPIFGEEGPRLLSQIEGESLAERALPDVVYLPAPFRFFAGRQLPNGEDAARAAHGPAVLRFYFDFDEKSHWGRIVTLDDALRSGGDAMGAVIQRFVAELPSVEAWLDWAFDSEPCEEGRARGPRLMALLKNLYDVTGLLRFQRQRYLSALAGARRCGDRLGEANVQKALGDLALREADLAEARRRYQAALQIYPAIGARLGEANVLRALGDLALREADLAEARRCYQAALQIYPAIGDRLGEANVLQALGDLALREDDLAEARRCYQAALQIYPAIGARLGEANVQTALGDLARREADLAAARRCYQAALQIYPAIGARLGEANVQKGLGNIAMAEGDPAAAFERFRSAFATHIAIGDRLGAGGALGYMARAASSAGSGGQAVLLTAEALNIFREIGERLGQALSTKDQGDFFWELQMQQPALAAWWQARSIGRTIGLSLARQLDGVFAQIEQMLGTEQFAQLQTDLETQAEAWRVAGVEAVRRALESDQPD